MLLSAGRGTRLAPLTDTTPKPLVAVGGRALIDYTLDRFAEAALERVVVNTHHLAEQLQAHLEARRAGGYVPRLLQSAEPTLLESGGGVVAALAQLDAEHFATANADAFWVDAEQPAVARMAAAFDPSRMDALLLLQPLDRVVGYHGPGNFGLTGDGQLARVARPEFVFTGLALWSARAFQGYRPEPFSLRVLFEAARGEDGRLHRMYGLVHDGDWVHVGTPEELAEAEAFLSR